MPCLEPRPCSSSGRLERALETLPRRTCGRAPHQIPGLHGSRSVGINVIPNASAAISMTFVPAGTSMACVVYDTWHERRDIPPGILRLSMKPTTSPGRGSPPAGFTLRPSPALLRARSVDPGPRFPKHLPHCGGLMTSTWKRSLRADGVYDGHEPGNEIRPQPAILLVQHQEAPMLSLVEFAKGRWTAKATDMTLQHATLAPAPWEVLRLSSRSS